VFNLVSKRYIFLIISLIIIIPGVISLIFKGFDVGIDFASGSSIEFRPAQQVTSTTQLTNLLEKVGLKDVSVIIGNDTNTAAQHVAWVRFDTSLDGTTQTTAINDLQNGNKGVKGYGSGLLVTPNPLQLTPANGGKAQTVTVLTLVSKTTNLNAATIKSLLAGLTIANPAASATPATTPTVTPAATPKATSTPAASSGSATTPATTPVNVSDVALGQTTATINILTTSTTSTNTLRQIQAAFLSQTNNYLYTLDSASISPDVASATIRNSILAVIAASVLILFWVWFAFRKVNKPWRYGACAIIALLHDVLVVMGVFSILGWTLHIQIDELFITALLTVVGFSVHDTIVVFDRIRENMQRRSSESFEQIVNASLVQTLSRSLNTSLTVLFTLSALTLFGGASTQTFTLALLVGIFSGTYSSIFNASMLLVVWERGELGMSRFNHDGNNRVSEKRKRRQAEERQLAKSRS
jgi:preprotein translocase SecF subunit